MNSSTIDLHVHTTASDGTLSPSDTVRRAAELGVTLLSITDHDTTEGIPEAQQAAAASDIVLLSGVELSVGSGEREIHVLGYFIDPNHRPFQTILSKLRGARDVRNERILARLKELGASVDPQRVRHIAGDGSVGRPHIAAALVEAGHVASQGEAFGRYLARGKPAYVGRERLSAADAAQAIREAGGLPVVAHPAKSGLIGQIEDLAAGGMEGIEVFHSDHSERDVEILLGIAREGNLLVTGGTDSHGPGSGKWVEIGSVAVPKWVGEELLRRAPQAERAER